MHACPWAEGTLNEAALWGERQDHVPCGGDRTTGKKLGPDAIVVSAIRGDRILYGKNPGPRTSLLTTLVIRFLEGAAEQRHLIQNRA